MNFLLGIRESINLRTIEDLSEVLIVTLQQVRIIDIEQLGLKQCLIYLCVLIYFLGF